MIFYMNVFYFSLFHWLLHGEQGSMNMSTVLNKQGGRALWCYSVQRSYASNREVRADHPDVPATWLSLTWWSCWNIGQEGWISFFQAVCFTIAKRGTSSFMTSALDAWVFVQVCVWFVFWVLGLTLFLFKIPLRGTMNAALDVLFWVIGECLSGVSILFHDYRLCSLRSWLFNPQRHILHVADLSKRFGWFWVVGLQFCCKGLSGQTPLHWSNSYISMLSHASGARWQV